MTVSKSKVTCFHDGECPICTIEINAMKRLDKEGNVKWVNIAQDKTALATAGLTYKQAMERMYVIDDHQQLQSGVMGFLQVWKQLPYYRIRTNLTRFLGVATNVSYIVVACTELWLFALFESIG